VPRIVYLTSALRDLAKIASDIEEASQSRSVAITFTDKLTDYCEHIAQLPGLLGRARHELRSEYRSLTFGSYVIFFRYVNGSTPREIMEIIHVVYGARDMEAFFHRTYGDS
jgi:toxin ParE1/3/4